MASSRCPLVINYLLAYVEGGAEKNIVQKVRSDSKLIGIQLQLFTLNDTISYCTLK